MVLADSHGIPRVPCYSGDCVTLGPRVSSTGLSPTPVLFPTSFDYTQQHISVSVMLNRTHTPHNTVYATPARLTRTRFRLIRFRSPLLPESFLFSLPTGTEMFHFPAFPPPPYELQMMVTRHNPSQVPPFGHPRINTRSPTPRGISQAATSFISSWYQGIHRMPTKTKQNHRTKRCSQPLYSSPTTHPHHQPPTQDSQW